jgi:hypothetical protein
MRARTAKGLDAATLFVGRCGLQNPAIGDAPSHPIDEKELPMTNPFFDQPVLNSPYTYPERHWELDEAGQPTQRIIGSRRRAEFVTPIPKPKKVKGAVTQQDLVFDEGQGLPRLSSANPPVS